MKRKLLIGLLAASVLGLAACNTNHTHSFSSEWSSDDNIHWHACECDTNVLDSVAAHVDSNKDEKCDVCGHAVPNNEHEHSFKTEWSSNDSIHWHACECATNVLDSVGAHVDDNNDGVCDVCSYSKEHEHTYATEYSSDANGHWHNSNCGHSVTTEVEAHTANSYGLCSVCGYKVAAFEPENVSTAIDAVVDHASNVYNGNVKYSTCYYSEWNDVQEYNLESATDFAFKDGYFFTQNGTVKTYYYPYGDTALGVLVTPSGAEKVNATAENLNGYEFVLSDFIYGLEEEYAYGSENLVAALYDAAETTSITDVNEEITEVDGVKVYSFSYIAYSALFYDNYYQYASYVNVSFTINEETLAIDTLTANTEFVPSFYTDYETWTTQYNISEEVDEQGNTVYVISDDANFEYAYKYEIKQNVDTSKEESYAPEDVLYSNFDVENIDTLEVVGDTLTVTVGENNTYTIVNPTPETSIPALNSVEVYYNGELASFWETDIISVYDSSLNTFTIKGMVAGTYEIKVVAGNYTKVFTLIVERPVPQTISPSVLDGNGWSYSNTNAVTITLGSNLIVKASVDNEYADDSYELTFAEEYAAASVTDSTLYNGSKELTFTAVGEYVVVIKSIANPDLVVELIVTVEEVKAPTVDITGTYTGDSFTMTINSDNTVSIDYGSFVSNGTLVVSGSNITFTMDMNVYGVSTGVINADGSIAVETTGAGTVVFVKNSSSTPSVNVVGEYECGMTNPMGITNYSYLIIGADGTVSFDFTGYVCSGTYAVDGTAITFALDTNVYGVGDGVVNADGSITVSTSANGDMTFVVMGGTQEPEPEDPIIPGGEASDYETAMTQTWLCSLGANDDYHLTFDVVAGTVKVENHFEGSIFGSSLYSFTYNDVDGLVLTFIENLVGDTDLLSWYFGSLTASFDSSFTVLTLGYYNFTPLV